MFNKKIDEVLQEAYKKLEEAEPELQTLKDLAEYFLTNESITRFQFLALYRKNKK
jgi:hypothetical protein